MEKAPISPVKSPLAGLWDQAIDICSNEIESWKQFSIEKFLEFKVDKVGIGALAGLGLFFCLDQYNSLVEIGQGSPAGMDVLHMGMQIVHLSLIVKVGFLGLVTLVIPYLEEFLFRGMIYELWRTDESSTTLKVVKVAANGLLFALFHIPAFLPSVQILPLVVLFLMGTAYTALRALTEDRVAATAAHITYNSAIFTMIFLLARRA